MTEWTQDQLRAIEGKANILVNAAAGSGKTAVLTERITRKLIPDEKGDYIGIDELLVVTFARDAAREMQERIKKSLSDRLSCEKNRNTASVLKTQIKKLPFADITTIDAFCMKLVKNNFHLLGIDSRFNIMSTDEAKIYARECICEYFSKLYEDKDEKFLMLSELYATNYTDRNLEDAVYCMYSFTRSLADPDEWLREHSKDYLSFSSNHEYRILMDRAHAQAEYIEKCLENMLKEYKSHVGTDDEKALSEYGKQDVYSLILKNLKAASVIKEASWDEIYERTCCFNVLDKRKFGYSDDEAVTYQKKLVDEMTSLFAPINDTFAHFTNEYDEANRYYKNVLYPQADALVDIVCGFSKYYFDKKSISSRFEFNDLEHMTIKLLREFEGIRKGLENKYKEILMDEYQDTNELQEAIFSMISNGRNRFIVGDMKQSIYRFRQSDPLIFLKMDMLYKGNSEKGERIVLSKNFRSRENVLNSINYLFENIMTRAAGEIDYDGDQALYYGNHSFDESADSRYASELYVLEGVPTSTDDETMSDIEREADFTAKKIKEMIDSGFKVLGRDGKERVAEESDFAILLGSVRTTAEIYIDALTRYGISANVEDSGFFEKTEIRLVIEFIKAVNNPLRDIPLLSVMRSPVYRFTDTELAKIRLVQKGEFYRAVKAASKLEGRLGEKCRSFVSELEKWRGMSLYMTADRLIWKMVSESSLYDMCSILYGGNAARANIRLLIERARDLSENGIATLFDFENYIVRMSVSDNVPCAKRSFGGVTIMTIHKSKGLEFPVVFVCSVGKKFVSDTSNEKVYMHKKYGFGINGFEKGGSISVPSHHRVFISNVKKNEAISEQLRKLYVALTRAKEKLIVIGTAPNTKKESTFAFTDREVCDDYILSCKRYINMIAPVIKRCEDKNLWIYNEIPYSLSNTEEIVETDNKNERLTAEVKRAVFEILDKYDSAIRPETVLSKVSVSALKSASGFSVKLRKLPKIMADREDGGALYGTAVHSVMEKISFKKSGDDKYILSECGGNEEIASKIKAFFNSPIGERAAGADVVREAPFEISIPAITQSGEKSQDETMLLQGIIDCYFEEDGEIVLIDYKTDVCTDISELAEKYYIQLKWYKYAIENILKKNVKEVYIYSFHKNKELKINIEDYDNE